MRIAVIACGMGLLTSVAAQAQRPAEGPVLLPGCALPAARLISSATPVDVELRLAVDPSGAVAGVEIARSSGRADVDAAFAGAAQACRFTSFAPSPLPWITTREHPLHYRHDGPEPPMGVHACFPTDYPAMALRQGDEGSNTILFRVPAGDAPPEVKLSRSSGSRFLDEEAVLRANRCLANAGVRAELAPDKWYRQSYRWVLQ
jgi:TonB family protein